MPSVPLYAHPLFQKLTGCAWRPGGLELTRHGLQLCTFTAGMRVLDVGCGAGGTLELLQAQGVQAVGLDVAPQCSHAPVVRAHAAYLPLATACVDGIVCECVLSLVQDTDAVLAGFARVLRRGGVLLLADLFVHGAVPASTPTVTPSGQAGAFSGLVVEPAPLTTASCTDGAFDLQTLEHALAHTGFHIVHFADHTAVLRPLAAQLLWHGLACAGACNRRWGYGLWIAQKQ